MTQNKKILFLTLRCFSLTGGIENVCKSICYHFNQLYLNKEVQFKMISIYDDLPDEQYINPNIFSSFKGHLITACYQAIYQGIQQDVIILSHINLAPIGLIIKLFRPKVNLILWTHGIEIWRPIGLIKKLFLKHAHQIIAVSNFTAKSLTIWHQVKPHKIKVISNSLDPFFKFPDLIDSYENVCKQYRLKANATIFMAVCRIKSSEHQKNYDLVIKALAQLKKEGFNTCYFLCGKYEATEYQRLKQLAIDLNYHEELILTGYLTNDEIIHLQQAANTFVLPSEKEGFGLVFIEAQAVGLRIITGNKDGSIDTILDPVAGQAINPTNLNELKSTLINCLQKPSDYTEKLKIQEECKRYFSYQNFSTNLSNHF